MVAIKTEKLSKKYRMHFWSKEVKALSELNIEINQGEIFGFLGPNGAGKTTTIKILLSIVRPTHGKGWVLGKPIGDISTKQKIGFLPENPYFYEHLKGWEFLDLSGMLFGINKKERKNRIEELLTELGISEARNMQLRKYSKGMLQRIGLAQALINEPELVILDEPLSGLDPLGRKQVKELILSLREQGKTVFFSSHILPDVEMLCDRIGILMSGRLQYVGSVDEILEEKKLESVELTIQGILGEKQEMLRKLAQRVVEREGKILFIFNNKDDADKALEYTLKEGGKVISYIPQRRDLEEIFETLIK